jgi:hypothetical protein
MTIGRLSFRTDNVRDMCGPVTTITNPDSKIQGDASFKNDGVWASFQIWCTWRAEKVQSHVKGLEKSHGVYRSAGNE